MEQFSFNRHAAIHATYCATEADNDRCKICLIPKAISDAVETKTSKYWCTENIHGQKILGMMTYWNSYNQELLLRPATQRIYCMMQSA